MVKRVRAHVNPLSVLKEYDFEGFSNRYPIVIDIGSFKGEFVESLALQHPRKNYIAFEIRVPIAQFLKQKFKSFDNVVVFDGDAGRNLKSILLSSLEKNIPIETIYINFPDPWFKEKHKKRRFITSSSLAYFSTFIPKETVFVFQTDQQFLFEETKEIITHSVYNHIEYFDDSPFGVRTDWEQSKIEQGFPIYRLKFWRD